MPSDYGQLVVWVVQTTKAGQTFTPLERFGMIMFSPGLIMSVKVSVSYGHVGAPLKQEETRNLQQNQSKLKMIMSSGCLVITIGINKLDQ